MKRGANVRTRKTKKHVGTFLRYEGRFGRIIVVRDPNGEESKFSVNEVEETPREERHK